MAHADVLVARKVATDEIFEEATGAEISRLTDLIVSDMEFEGAQAAETARFFQLGVFGALAALLVMWAAMGVLRVADTRSARRPSNRDALATEPSLPVAAAPSDRGGTREPSAVSTGRASGRPAPASGHPRALPGEVVRPAAERGALTAAGRGVADPATAGVPAHTAPSAGAREWVVPARPHRLVEAGGSGSSAGLGRALGP